jgi:hypothetical protein
MQNIEASYVDNDMVPTSVTDPADNVFTSCVSGCSVSALAYDSDASGSQTDCDYYSEISSSEDGASDSDDFDYEVESLEECESESELDDFGTPQRHSEE